MRVFVVDVLGALVIVLLIFFAAGVLMLGGGVEQSAIFGAIVASGMALAVGQAVFSWQAALAVCSYMAALYGCVRLIANNRVLRVASLVAVQSIWSVWSLYLLVQFTGGA